MRPSTLWDRLMLGSISAVAGALLGSVLALFVALASEQFHASMVIASTAYFFVVGFVKGAAAGDFAGEALGVTVSAVAAMGSAAVDPTSAARTGSASSIALWVGYCAVVVLAAALW
jgi:hypothetical protein